MHCTAAEPVNIYLDHKQETVQAETQELFWNCVV